MFSEYDHSVPIEPNAPSLPPKHRRTAIRHPVLTMSKCFGPFKELFKGLFVHGQKIAEFNQTRQMTQITQAKSGYVEKLVQVAMQKPFF